MSRGTEVELVHAWGCHTAMRDNLAFKDQSDLIFPVGRCVGFQSIENGAMHFLPQEDKHNKVTAMSVSPNHRYLMVCETLPRSPPQASIYDLRTGPHYRKLKSLKKSDTPWNAEIQACCFSGDSKYVALHTADPDWTVSVWNWNSKKMLCIGSINVGVSRMTFNPLDSSQLCMSGRTVFRLWRSIGAELSPFPPFAGVKSVEIFNDHAWTDDDRIVAVSNAGRIVVIDECEVRQEFQSPLLSELIQPLPSASGSRPGTAMSSFGAVDRSSKRAALRSVVTHRTGFVVGGLRGVLMLFDRDDGDFAAGAAAVGGPKRRKKPEFIFTRTLDVMLKGVPTTVAGLCLSPTQESLGLCMMGGLGVLQLSTIGLMADGVTTAQVQVVSDSLHTEAITGMDICKSKPLVTTVSRADGKVVVWNYPLRRAIASRSFGESSGPLSVSIHPAGHTLLVALPGRAVVLSLVMGELQDTHDISAGGISFGKYSEDGGKFALAVKKQVWVYSSFGERGPVHIGTLFGHSASVSSVSWTHDDSRLVTVGLDGACLHWDLNHMKKPPRVGECISGRSFQYSASTWLESGGVVAAFSKSPSTGDIEFDEDDDVGTAAPPTSPKKKASEPRKSGAARSRRKSARGGPDTSPEAGSKRYLRVPGPGGGGGGSTHGGEMGTVTRPSSKPYKPAVSGAVSDSKGEDELDSVAQTSTGGASAAPRTVSSMHKSSGAAAVGIHAWEGLVNATPEGMTSTSPIVSLAASCTVIGDLIWAGTESGSIFEVSWPLEGGTVGQLGSCHFHQAAVSTVACAANTVFMFSAGCDGALMMMAVTKIADRALRAGGVQQMLGGSIASAPSTPAVLAVTSATELSAISRRERRIRQLLAFTSSPDGLILVPESLLAAQVSQIEELKTSMEDQKKRMEAQASSDLNSLQLQRANETEEWSREKREMSKRFQVELAELEAQKEAMAKQLQAQEERHMDVAGEMETLYEAKIAKLVDQAKELQSQYDDLVVVSEAKEAEYSAVSEAAKRRIVDHCKEILHRSKSRESDLKSYVEYVKEEYDRMLEAQDQEHDSDFIQHKAQMVELQRKYDDLQSQLKSERTQMSRTVHTLRESLDKAAAEAAKLEQARLQEVAKRKAVKADLKAIREDAEERYTALRQRDAQLSDNDARIKELERSRRVLQQQLSDMRASLQPKDEEITMLRDQIAELDSEFQAANRASMKKQGELDRKTQRLNTVTEKMKRAESKLRARENLLRQIRQGLDVIVTSPLADWKRGLRDMHRKYVVDLELAGSEHEIERRVEKALGSSGLAADSSALGLADNVEMDDTAAEFHRQRRYMERAVAVMQRKAERDSKKATGNVHTQLKENTELLEQLNETRMERNHLVKRVSALEGEIESLKAVNSGLATRVEVMTRSIANRGSHPADGPSSSHAPELPASRAGPSSPKRPAVPAQTYSPNTSQASLEGDVDPLATSMPVARLGGPVSPSHRSVVPEPASPPADPGELPIPGFPARKPARKPLRVGPHATKPPAVGVNSRYSFSRSRLAKPGSHHNTASAPALRASTGRAGLTGEQALLSFGLSALPSSQSDRRLPGLRPPSPLQSEPVSPGVTTSSSRNSPLPEPGRRTLLRGGGNLRALQQAPTTPGSGGDGYAHARGASDSERDMAGGGLAGKPLGESGLFGEPVTVVGTLAPAVMRTTKSATLS